MEACRSSYRQLLLDPIALHFLNLETSATRLARNLLVNYAFFQLHKWIQVVYCGVLSLACKACAQKDLKNMCHYIAAHLCLVKVLEFQADEKNSCVGPCKQCKHLATPDQSGQQSCQEIC